nr:rab-like protein 3 [Drosophila bipectinata]
MEPIDKNIKKIALNSAELISDRKKYFKQKMQDIPTIRVLLLGDKGVGKTSLTNLVAKSRDTPTTKSRTVGDTTWTMQVRLHEYPAPLVPLPPFPILNEFLRMGVPPPPPTTLYFVEFYDPTTELRMRREDRISFFKKVDGIILVHSLMDVSSQDSLHDWLYEPLRQIGKHRHGRSRPFLPGEHVPIMVVGTKVDLVDYTPTYHPGSIAYQLNATEILVNCRDLQSFGEKTCNQLKLHRFLNRVVEFQLRFPLLEP